MASRYGRCGKGISPPRPSVLAISTPVNARSKHVLTAVRPPSPLSEFRTDHVVPQNCPPARPLDRPILHASYASRTPDANRICPAPRTRPDRPPQWGPCPRRSYVSSSMVNVRHDALTFGLNYGRVLLSGDDRVSYHIRNLSVRRSSHFVWETPAIQNTEKRLSDIAEKSP